MLEVPGATVGLETACPFCNKILTIPAPKHSAGTVAGKRVPASAPHPGAFSSPKSKVDQPVAASQSNAGNPYVDPLGDPSLFLADSSLPPLEPQPWSIPSGSPRKRTGAITFAKSFNMLLDRSFPACLYLIPQAILPVLPAALVVGVIKLAGWMMNMAEVGLSRETASVVVIASLVILVFVTLLLSLVSQCWMINLSLHCTRGGKVSSEVFFGGANIVFKLILVSVAACLLSAIIYAFLMLPVFLLVPSSVRAIAMVFLALLAAPLYLLPYLAIMFAPYAMIDGEGIATAVSTSLKIFKENWSAIIGVVITFMFVHMILNVLTLGLAGGLPFFLVASMYVQVRPKAKR